MAIVGAAVFAAASWVDFPVLREVGAGRWGENDLTRMFRVMGFLPVWLVVALVIGRLDSWRPAWLLAGGATLSGVAGEVLKLVLRRERPGLLGESYTWRSWGEFNWSTSGLALPSAHAVVAFGAAWMLCRLYPRATPVWLGLATGCAATRVLARAHYVSDCALAAVVAYAVVWALWERAARPTRGA